MLRPINDNVLISLVREEKTASGIILAQTENIPQVGIVEAVGPGCINDSGVRVKPDVEVGQKIIFNKYSGTELEDNGKRYLMIKDRDILAVM
jgi:chaperonin GroES